MIPRTALVLALLLCVWAAAGGLDIARAQVGDTGQQGGGDLDYPFGSGELKGMAREAFNWAIFIIVVSAAIFIGIGAYFYFAAAGNAQLAGQGKEIITRAIMGLVIALIAFVILKTISPQFTDLPNPSLGGGGGR